MRALAVSFLLAVSIGVLCVYMVLVLLFSGFMQPVTVMAALPLSMGGAFAALLVTRSSLSMPSLLGLLMLMGIAGQKLDPAGRIRAARRCGCDGANRTRR